MSRQSKAVKNRARAKQITEMHKRGEKGPSATKPLHGKRWTYRNNPVIQKQIAEAIKATSVMPEKTSGKKILENAGGAAA